MARVVSLYRYPVKGFSPEARETLAIEPGRPIAGDRIYAVENGPSGFDPAAPAFIPKSKFLCLMKNARLAALETRFDHAVARFSIARGGRTELEASLAEPAGRAAVEDWLSAFMGDEKRGNLRIVSAPGHTFADVGKPVISFINLASVVALEGAVGKPVDPLRFRANLYLDGLDAWAEHDLIGREAKIGDARVRFVKRTQRCVATNVNPATAERDMDIPATLLRTYDHMDCGVYAEILAAGTLARDAAITLL